MNIWLDDVGSESECNENIQENIENYYTIVNENEDIPQDTQESENNLSIQNEELFLKLVCNYPAIYNPQNKGYSNKLMKENAFQAIAGSMQTSVENCKKKWKALKEKYNREKQKLDVLSRSGAPAFNLSQWNLMSFFQFMYDKQPPRRTESSPLMCNTSSSTTASCSGTVQNAIPSTPTRSSQLKSNISYNRTKSIADVNRPNKRKKSEQPESGDSEVVNILSQISNSVSNVTNSESKQDKLRDFANYLISELREFATDQREEFIDETVIRLLQSKRKSKKL